jgi:Type IV secretory system Conjugative DNA transfer
VVGCEVRPAARRSTIYIIRWLRRPHELFGHGFERIGPRHSRIAALLLAFDGGIDPFGKQLLGVVALGAGEKTSHSLLVGAILHVLYAEADKTLAGVANFLSDPSQPIDATLNVMLATAHLGDRVHPVVASAARELLNKSENERSGVLSTTMSFLGLYRDPVVAKVTGRSDWRIRDLVDGPRPISLYLVVPPSDIARTKPLMRLILNQIGRRLTEILETGRRRQKLLLMLDEFAALGRLDFFESQLAFMAGYGIRSFLITQSLNQSNAPTGLTTLFSITAMSGLRFRRTMSAQPSGSRMRLAQQPRCGP